MGALHMSAQVRTVVWPRLANERDADASPYAPERSHSADEVGRGLLSLAESLHDELAPAFDTFASQWLNGDADRMFDDIRHIALALSED